MQKYAKFIQVLSLLKLTFWNLLTFSSLESYNPHVRYGAALALGISCAGRDNIQQCIFKFRFDIRTKISKP